MSLNGLGPRAVRRVARDAGLPVERIARATVRSHDRHWLVWLTLSPHWHAVYDQRTGELELLPTSPPSPWCTSLCRELYPEDYLGVS